MTETEDDLASANAKLAVLASLAGFIASPVAVGLLQLGAPWVLRLAFVVFLLGGVAAVRLPKSADVSRARAAAPPDPGSLGGLPVSGGVQGQPDAGKTPLRASGRSDRDRQARIDVARERQRLGLPLYSPDVVLGLATMSVIRGAVGFLTFFLAFALRHLHAATWWFGFVLLTSAIGSLLGSLLVPVLRRYLSEQQLILYSLMLCALSASSSPCSGPCGRSRCSPSPSASRPQPPSRPSTRSRSGKCRPPCSGRAFARFETQLQLVWVLCGLLAVLVGLSLRAGDILDRRELRRGRRLPRLDAPGRAAAAPNAGPGTPTFPAHRSTERQIAQLTGPPETSPSSTFWTCAVLNLSRGAREESGAGSHSCWHSPDTEAESRWQASPDGCSSSRRIRGGSGGRPRRPSGPARACVGDAKGCDSSHAAVVAAPAGRAATGPLVVHIPDPRSGEIHLMFGTREVVRKDSALVARLVREAG